VHRQDPDIDILINSGKIKTENYSTDGASVVVQAEISGFISPPVSTDDIVNASAVPGADSSDALNWLLSETLKHYNHTITVGDLALKYFYLPNPPSNLLRVIMRVRGAPDQKVGYDFQAVFDGRIRWQGFPLDGVLSVGDIVEVLYT